MNDNRATSVLTDRLEERLSELLADLERLPTLPRTDTRSERHVAICAEIEGILEARLLTRLRS